MRARSPRGLTLPALLGLALSAGAGLAEDSQPETRQPWARSNERFIRSWLVVGGFPADQAGEIVSQLLAAVPEPGTEVARADGEPARWQPHKAWGDEVDLTGPLNVDGEGANVGYAFAEVTRDATGPARVSVGSDEGIRVWLNGVLVHERQGERPLRHDEDAVDIEMREGRNTLLVESEQRRGPWVFTLRVLEPGSELARVREIAPAIVDSATGTLSIRTDAPGDRVGLAPVSVQIVAAGGDVVASQEAPRGEVVRFDTGAWADGPYEARCTTTRPDGRRFVVHLAWYEGDALAAARELVAEAEEVATSTPYGISVEMLAEMVLDRLGGEVAGGPDAWERIHAPLMEHAELKLAEAGEAGPVRPYGFVRLAWRDPVDDSPQFCRAYLPPGYDPARPWPMSVQLHGYNHANPRYVGWWAVDQRHTAEADELGVIHIEPHGRGNTRYRGMGEHDVLRAIALAKERFNVDEDRVYLMGDSMGGWGTWHVGTRHPEVFAAIAPVYGGADYRLQMPAGMLESLSDAEHFIFEQLSSFAQAEALLTTPILIVHGDADEAVDVEYSRHVVRMLQRWGYDVRYWELPGWGHEDLHARLPIVEWFLKHERDAHPRKVHVRAGELKSASAHWVRVERRENPEAFVDAVAEVLDPNVIRLDTRNAAVVTLSPGGPLVDPGAPLEVIWNGELRQVSLTEAGVTLGAEALSGHGIRKRPELDGPIEDFFARPFAVVIGTTGDALARELCERKARVLVSSWERWQHQTPRVLEDHEVTRAHREKLSLLLIGGPDANAVSEALDGRVPLEVSADGFVIDGQSFPASEAVVQMLYPSPWNAEHYVLVVAGTSSEALYFWEPMTVDQGVGPLDFTIADGRVRMAPQPAQVGARLRVASGRFDEDWSLAGGLLIAGDAEMRSARPLARVPRSDHGFDMTRFSKLVGRYQVERGPSITIVQEGTRLFADVSGQPRGEILPLSETQFGFADVNVGLEFSLDAEGRATGLNLSQGAQQMPARRVE
jgi:dienelactone hydrolase